MVSNTPPPPASRPHRSHRSQRIGIARHLVGGGDGGGAHAEVSTYRGGFFFLLTCSTARKDGSKQGRREGLFAPFSWSWHSLSHMGSCVPWSRDACKSPTYLIYFILFYFISIYLVGESGRNVLLYNLFFLSRCYENDITYAEISEKKKLTRYYV